MGVVIITHRVGLLQIVCLEIFVNDCNMSILHQRLLCTILLQVCGQIDSVKVFRENDGWHNRGTGFVNFVDPDAPQQAINRFNNILARLISGWSYRSSCASESKKLSKNFMAIRAFPCLYSQSLFYPHVCPKGGGDRSSSRNNFWQSESSIHKRLYLCEEPHKPFDKLSLG